MTKILMVEKAQKGNWKENVLGALAWLSGTDKSRRWKQRVCRKGWDPDSKAACGSLRLAECALLQLFAAQKSRRRVPGNLREFQILV